MKPETEWPLWEVFVRTKAGLDHKHCGSLHATDAKMAVQMARDVYTRRQEGSSVWVVRSDQIVASDPGDKDMYFDPAEDKVYRHPTFYKLPDSTTCKGYRPWSLQSGFPQRPNWLTCCASPTPA